MNPSRGLMDATPSEPYTLFVRPDMASGDLPIRSAGKIRGQHPAREVMMMGKRKVVRVLKHTCEEAWHGIPVRDVYCVKTTTIHSRIWCNG